MVILLTLLAIIVILLLNGLFVAAEYAAVSAHLTKFNQMAAQGDPVARRLLAILGDNRKQDRFVTACQIGITICSLVLGAFAYVVLANRLTAPLAELLDGTLSPAAAVGLAHAIAVIAVFVLVVVLQVILGELLPKSLAIRYPEETARAVFWPMRVLLVLFALPAWLVTGSANVILRLLGRNGRDFMERAHSAEEIEKLVTTSHEGGLLDDNERLLLRNTLRMRDLSARQVMVHRTRIEAATIEATPLELMQMAIDAGFSRIPLYQDSIDNIIGFVHVKDVFRLYSEGAADLSTIMRDVVYVPETMPINDVWDQLDLQNRYLAVVFDEFGGTAGLLTLEDLIEEIFGELQDEFDDEAAVIARDKDGRIYLRGDLLIADVNEYLELDLPEDTTDTLSGLVFSILGRPPVVGDEVRIGEVVILVETMEDLGVGELSLLLPSGDAETPFTEWDIVDHD